MISSGTGPLESYLAKVLAPEDRVLFEEAVRSAAVGASRAAYIMVWISCAESLKRKFRELAPRDSQAQLVLGEVARKELAQQSIDKYILGEAKKYGFVDESEHRRLEHIYTMRSIYGHPYEEQPSTEDLVAAAATVADLVLSRPTKLREGYLAEQVRLITEDRTFLDDVTEAAERYAADVCAKADERLHQWFLRKLWSRLTAMVTDPTSAMFVRRGIWFSREYVRRSCCIGSVGWDAVSYLTQFPATLSSILAAPDLFQSVGTHAQDIVIGNLFSTGALDGAHLRLLEGLHNSGVFNARQENRFNSEIRQLQLDHIASSGVSPVYYADLIVAKLKVHNWYVQNRAVGVLKNAGPNGIAHLPSETQYLLGENILQAADGGANAGIAFLEDLGRTANEWPEAFIEGLVSECFINGKDEIRFKTAHARKALKTLRVLGRDSRAAMVDRLVTRVMKGNLQPYWGTDEKRTKVLGIIEDVFQDEGDGPTDLLRLSEVLAALGVPYDDE